MNVHHLPHAALDRVVQISSPRLDSIERRPRIWAALLAGAGLGLLWGIAARAWMRLIATKPEFTIAGTVAILVIATLFGLWTGLAFAARRRGWRSWRHYLPRVIATVFFLPFGIAGGLPLMLTVLLITLARCQRAIIGLCVATGLAALLESGPAAEFLPPTTTPLLVLTIALAAWKAIRWLWRGGAALQRVDRWLELLGRGVLMLLALGLLWLVGHEVLSDHPNLRGALSMALYLPLIFTLHLGLRISLARRSGGNGGSHQRIRSG